MVMVMVLILLRGNDDDDDGRKTELNSYATYMMIKEKKKEQGTRIVDFFLLPK